MATVNLCWSSGSRLIVPCQNNSPVWLHISRIDMQTAALKSQKAVTKNFMITKQYRQQAVPALKDRELLSHQFSG